MSMKARKATKLSQGAFVFCKKQKQPEAAHKRSWSGKHTSGCVVLCVSLAGKTIALTAQPGAKHRSRDLRKRSSVTTKEAGAFRPTFPPECFHLTG